MALSATFGPGKQYPRRLPSDRSLARTKRASPIWSLDCSPRIRQLSAEVIQKTPNEVGDGKRVSFMSTAKWEEVAKAYRNGVARIPPGHLPRAGNCIEFEVSMENLYFFGLDGGIALAP